MSGCLEPPGVVAMSKLREKMAADLRLKGFRPKVIAAIKARLRDLRHDSGPAEEPSEAL
jgi:hypothetical protein